MSRSHQQVNFRMALALREALEAAAEINKRSLTAEINARLENSFLAGNEDEPVQAGQHHASLHESGQPILLALDKKLNALCKHLGLDVSQLGDS